VCVVGSVVQAVHMQQRGWGDAVLFEVQPVGGVAAVMRSTAVRHQL
jgi:hypothetical protein